MSHETPLIVPFFVILVLLRDSPLPKDVARHNIDRLNETGLSHLYPPKPEALVQSGRQTL
eukprot:1195062-Prorocentrum_minimum.AAC.5